MKKRILSGFLILACSSALALAHDKPSTQPSKDDDCSACHVKAATQPTAKAKSVNTLCPVQNDEIDPNVTVVYEGKTIGFCCQDCIKDFKSDPAKYMAHMK
jgi:YHS domain-containing protein